MKKKTINAFTLVEMLIVIVIIGILIAALMPRMQAAQGRARDVSRKTALSQVQSAIVTSQGDKGEWPGKCADGATSDCASFGLGLSSISGQLTTAGMNSVPTDPLKTDALAGLGDFSKNGIGANGDYAYIVTRRNGTEEGGFVLMAKTEVEGGSNRVVCTDENGAVITANEDLSHGYIDSEEDITNIHPCTEFDKQENPNTNPCVISGSKCTYNSDDQLRYIVLY